MLANQGEIQDLVQHDDLTRAIARLLDFAQESLSKDLVKEATVLSSRYNRYRKDRRGRLSAAEIDQRHSELSSAIVDLAEEIYDFISRTALLTQTTDGASRPVVESDHPPTPDVRPPRNLRPKASKNATNEPIQTSRPMFECRNLRKTYQATSQFALRDIEISLQPGQIMGIVGVNGSGKSTLLRIIAGELAATQGSMRYPALQINQSDWPSIRRQIAFVQQAPEAWVGTLGRYLELYAAAAGVMGDENRVETDFLFHRLGLVDFRDHTWAELSGGFKMRFELARALITKPKLVVLDEPLAPLDLIAQRVFLQDLRDIADSGQAPSIIMTLQHIFEIENCI
jgi:ABC-2 type transport system ATP-binding protein